MPVRKGGTLIRGNDLVRFWSKTEQQGECIVWTGTRTRFGHGKFCTGPHGGQKHHHAHRWIWEHLHGALGEGLVVRHRCDNPPCVNPEHLTPGTQRENVGDAIDRGRFTVGERNGNARLTEEVVRDIRHRVALGERPVDVARSLSISRTLVWQVVHRRLWGHVA
jgi:hypothetical protein